MNWVGKLGLVERSPSARIGPGRFILAVGPSGAGKDTLINLARAACQQNSGIVLPRRLVTRAACSFEDHDTVAEDAFDQAAADGAFALWWAAHGLKYGIPLSIDSDIRAGRTVVCNVSRSIIASARERYTNVCVVLITAPVEVLARRLEMRGRTTDGSVLDRIERSSRFDDALRADYVIENTGTPQQGAGRLAEIIERRCWAAQL